MTFTNTWDAAYELEPTDNDWVYQIDDFLRALKLNVRERMEIDHYWKAGSDDGKHKKITLPELSVVPSSVAGTGFIYTKEASGKTELFFEDEDGNEVQLTAGGVAASSFPSGTKMWFFQDTAPTNWTIDTTGEDSLLGVKGGSTYVTGGAVAGTWTQPDHTHAAGTFAVSGTTGTNDAGQGVGAYNIYILSRGPHRHSFSANVTGTSATSATAATWRPYASVGIICTKN